MGPYSADSGYFLGDVHWIEIQSKKSATFSIVWQDLTNLKVSRSMCQPPIRKIRDILFSHPDLCTGQFVPVLEFDGYKVYFNGCSLISSSLEPGQVCRILMLDVFIAGL